jgi:hypothetical protein
MRQVYPKARPDMRSDRTSLQLSDPERRTALSAWLNTMLRLLFARRSPPRTEDVILRSRLVVGAGRRRLPHERGRAGLRGCRRLRLSCSVAPGSCGVLPQCRGGGLSVQLWLGQHDR